MYSRNRPYRSYFAGDGTPSELHDTSLNPDSTVSSLSVFYPRYWEHACRFKGVGLWAEITLKLAMCPLFGVYVGLMSVFWPFLFGLQNVSNSIK